jgi:hypothetical protein
VFFIRVIWSASRVPQTCLLSTPEKPLLKIFMMLGWYWSHTLAENFFFSRDGISASSRDTSSNTAHKTTLSLAKRARTHTHTHIHICYSVRKVPDLICFCKNLVDLYEACLHEVTLNLYMHAWIFPRLSILSVDGKQHLSEVVFSALVGF